jgi:hypothetical protein
VSRKLKCTVRFIDRRGIEHSTDVKATSLFEAACRAWANFKSVDESAEESYKTDEFVVEVHQDPKVFRVDLEKLLAWIARGRRGHTDTSRKKWLRRLLDASIWGPPTVEEEQSAERGQFEYRL